MKLLNWVILLYNVIFYAIGLSLFTYTLFWVFGAGGITGGHIGRTAVLGLLWLVVGGMLHNYVQSVTPPTLESSMRAYRRALRMR